MQGRSNKMKAVSQNSTESIEIVSQHMELHSSQRGFAYLVGLKKWSIALVLSVAVHAGISGMFLTESEPVKIAGGATLEVAILGNAFADSVVAGEVTDAIEPEPITETQLTPVESSDALGAAQQVEITPEIIQAIQPIELVRELEVSPIEPTTTPSSIAETNPTVTEIIPAAAIVEVIEAVPSITAISAVPTVETPTVSTAVSAELMPMNTAAAIEPAEITVASLLSPKISEITEVLTAELSVVEPITNSSSVATLEPIEPPKKVIKKPKSKTVPKERKTPKKKASKKRPTKKKIKKPKVAKKKKQNKAALSKQKRKSSGKNGKAKISSKRGVANGKKKRGATRSGKSSKARNNVGNGNITNYKGKIRRKIVRRFRPGRVRDVKRNVVVRFTVSRNGRASSIRIARSSGSKKLDAAAIRAVKSASPFPPIPSSSSRSSIRVVVPMNVKR